MNCKQGVKTKNEVEMELNDLPLNRLPEEIYQVFKDIKIRPKSGRPHQKWGSMVRRYNPEIFHKYYDSITG